MHRRRITLTKGALVVALLAGLVLTGADRSAAATHAAPRTTGWPHAVHRHAKLDSSLWRTAGWDAGVADPGLQPASKSADPGAPVPVIVSGSDAAGAVREAGGVVTNQAGAEVAAQVPPGSLLTVADDSRVTMVRRDEPLWSDTTSEGVAASGADVWQTAGNQGTGVKVAIVDVGFAGSTGLGAELPIAGTYNAPGCSNPNATSHGTMVAQTVHDEAPGALLYLVCAQVDSDLADVEANFIEPNGITIANASLGNVGVTRGDGSGGPLTGSGAVNRGRQNGVLWVVSSGNEEQNHYGFVPANPGVQQLVHLPNNSPDDRLYGIHVYGTASIVLRWDAWPVTTQDFDLLVFDSGGNFLDGSFTTQNGSASSVPVEAYTITTPGDYYIAVGDYGDTSSPPDSNGDPTVAADTNRRFDLFFLGGIQSAQLAAGGGSLLVNSGSVSEPATSPAALAVGAYCVFDSPNGLEPYSSRGPTIDGRAKPDLVGPDGTATTFGSSSNCFGGGGFFGTSASAPHVTGAAALVKEASPTFDASAIQDVLERRASDYVGTGGGPGRDAGSGWGRLAMGAAPPPAPTLPAGELYAPLPAPVRIMDTRHNLGYTGAFVAGTIANLTVAGANGVPGDATAVVVNVTAINPSAAGYLTLWPAGQTRPGASNLNFGPTDVVSNGATVGVGAGGQISIYNPAGSVHVVVDIVGWYGPTGTTTGLHLLASPTRIVDTRSQHCPSGAVHCNVRVAAGEEVVVPIGGATVNGVTVPITATAVVVNVTAVGPLAAGHITVFPDGVARPNASSLNYTAGATRPNLVTAGLGGATHGLRVYALQDLDLVIDLLGYYDTGGLRFVPLRTPVRGLDTRTGNAVAKQPIPALGSVSVRLRNQDDVPTTASAVLVNATVVARGAPGYLTVDANVGSASAGTSNLNYVAGQVAANTVVTALASGGYNGRARFYSSAQADAVADILGYFT